jgi:hypothetical protein
MEHRTATTWECVLELMENACQQIDIFFSNNDDDDHHHHHQTNAA